MSILVSSRIARDNLGAMCAYLQRSKGGSLPRIEYAISDLGDGPASFNRAARRLLDKTMRKCDGQSLVVSFTETEFPSVGDHGQAVAEHAYEMVRRGAPGAPLLVVAQRDGAGGRWHAHVIVLNHDLATGRANRGAWRHDQWRTINDEYNREVGLQICGEEATMSRAARLAAARGTELSADADLVALAPSAVPKNDVDRYLGVTVLNAIADGHLTRVPDDGESLSIPLADHPGHHLSVRAKGTGLSYAITDDDGPVMCAAGARGGKPRRIASTGTKLDKALALGRADATYTRTGLAALLAVMEEEQEQEQEDARNRAREATTPQGRAGRSRGPGRDPGGPRRGTGMSAAVAALVGVDTDRPRSGDAATSRGPGSVVGGSDWPRTAVVGGDGGLGAVHGRADHGHGGAGAAFDLDPYAEVAAHNDAVARDRLTPVVSAPTTPDAPTLDAPDK